MYARCCCLIVSMFLLGLLGCKKDGSGAEGAGPGALGEQAGNLYVEGMKELVALLKDKPDAATVKPKVVELREKYIKQMVGIGKKREKLSDADKKTLDSAIMSKMRGVPPDTFKTYRELDKHYRPTDNELANTMASFNTITQYANFELLKKQLPKEAERLGV